MCQRLSTVCVTFCVICGCVSLSCDEGRNCILRSQTGVVSGRESVCDNGHATGDGRGRPRAGRGGGRPGGRGLPGWPRAAARPARVSAISWRGRGRRTGGDRGRPGWPGSGRGCQEQNERTRAGVTREWLRRHYSTGPSVSASDSSPRLLPVPWRGGDVARGDVWCPGCEPCRDQPRHEEVGHQAAQSPAQAARQL